jgi:F-type H+-transporting ATPase subunit gamma
MPSTREMRLRIRSVRNIAQVTRALETVSASKVRKAMAAVLATRPYTRKAWEVLVHLAEQPQHASLHPLLTERASVNKIMVIMVSSDRGLAGAYNVNILRATLENFAFQDIPVSYVAVGRKGRDLLARRGMSVKADFSDLPSPPSFMDVSALGRLAVSDFLDGVFDEVYLSYTEFHSMVRQEPVIQRLLPMDVSDKAIRKVFGDGKPHKHYVFNYEPEARQILDEIVPRFVAIQIYQAVLSAQASEHASRMVSMHNATDNAQDLIHGLQLDYNKARQQGITSDMLDITGGAEALNKGISA